VPILLDDDVGKLFGAPDIKVGDDQGAKLERFPMSPPLGVF